MIILLRAALILCCKNAMFVLKFFWLEHLWTRIISPQKEMKLWCVEISGWLYFYKNKRRTWRSKTKREEVSDHPDLHHARKIYLEDNIWINLKATTILAKVFLRPKISSTSFITTTLVLYLFDEVSTGRYHVNQIKVGNC